MLGLISSLRYSRLILISFLFVFLATERSYAQDSPIVEVAAFAVEKDGEKYIKVNYIINSSGVYEIAKIDLIDEYAEFYQFKHEDVIADIEGDIGFVSVTEPSTVSFKWYWQKTLAARDMVGKFKVTLSLMTKPYLPNNIKINLGNFSNQQYENQTSDVVMQSFAGPFEVFTPAPGLSPTGTWYESVEEGAVFFSCANVSNFPYYNHSSANFFGRPTLQSGSSFFAYKDVGANTRRVWICAAAGKMQGPEGYKKLWDFQIHIDGTEMAPGTAVCGIAASGSPDLGSTADAPATLDITYSLPESVEADEVEIVKKPSLKIKIVNDDYVTEPVKAGDELIFNITVTEPDGSGGYVPSADATVYVKNPIAVSGDFEPLVDKTDVDGKLTYKYTIPVDALERLFYLSFYAEKEGSNWDKSAVEQRNVNVDVEADLNVSVDPKSVKLKQTDTTEITVYVTEKDKAADLCNVKVRNEIIDPGNDIDVGVTNKDGRITYEFIVPEDQPEGEYELRFFANKGFDPDEWEGPAICKVVVGEKPMLMLFPAPNSAFKMQPTEQQKITITVEEDTSNTPVADAEIYIVDPFVDPAKETLLGKSDAEGKRVYDIVVPDKHPEGQYKLKFWAKKDDYFSSDTMYIKVNINNDPCWTYGIFEFCAKNGWSRDPAKPEIKADGEVTINNFLSFNGSLTIDTTIFKVTAEGKFQIKEIRLPGGGTGTFTFLEGKQELQLLGSEGLITNALGDYINSKLEVMGMGIQLKDISIIGDKNAEGIQLSAEITFPWFAGGCDVPEPNAKFEFVNLRIQRTRGIVFDGFNLGDVSIGPKFCLKNFTYNYNQTKDRLSLGIEAQFPPCEFGGGCAIEKGKLDSIGLMGKATAGGVPIGSTPICLIGGKGYVNGISSPPFEFKLGGIFSDCATHLLFEYTFSGFYKAPSTIGMELDGGMFMIPGTEFWQMTTTSAGELDWAAKIVKYTGEARIGTFDGTTYILNGSYKLGFQAKKLTSVGRVDGKIIIPDIAPGSDAWPLGFLRAALPGGLPYEATAAGTILVSPVERFIHTECNFGGVVGNISLDLDLTKTSDDPGFFNYNLGGGGILYSKRVKDEIPFLTDHKIEKRKNRNVILGETSRSINVPEDAQRIFIMISSDEQVPVSSVENPSGESFTDTNPDSTIVLANSETGKASYWILVEPESGEWKLKLSDPAENDSVKIYLVKPKSDFAIMFDQQDKNIGVSWTTDLIEKSDSLDIYIDDDIEDLDGIYIATVPASAGQYNFEYPDTLGYCVSYLYGMINRKGVPIYSEYADGSITSDKTSLMPPKDITASRNSSTGIVSVKWLPSTQEDVFGYTVVVTDQDGRDSVYATLFKFDNEIDLTIEDHENKRISMVSFDADGFSGCPSGAVDIITGLEYEAAIGLGNGENIITAFPNPTSGMTRIRIYLGEDSFVRLAIYDIFGNRIAAPAKGFYRQGILKTDWDASYLPTGTYYIRLEANGTVKSEMLILNK